MPRRLRRCLPTLEHGAWAAEQTIFPDSMLTVLIFLSYALPMSLSPFLFLGHSGLFHCLSGRMTRPLHLPFSFMVLGTGLCEQITARTCTLVLTCHC